MTARARLSTAGAALKQLKHRLITLGVLSLTLGPGPLLKDGPRILLSWTVLDCDVNCAYCQAVVSASPITHDEKIIRA